MKKIFIKIVLMSMIVGTVSCTSVFAGKLDTNVPMIDKGTISLDSDGTVTFTPPNYTTIATISGIPREMNAWKGFEAQLLKRYSVIDNGTTKYMYKKTGSVFSCDNDESEITFNFTKTGYYQVQIRGINLEGNYGYWSWQSWPNGVESSELPPGISYTSYTDYFGLPVEENDISPGGSSSGGSGSSGGSSVIGPGIAQTSTYPAGYQYAVVGPNGEILYYYGGNTSNGIYSGMGANNGMAYYQASGNQQILGPGYVNNMQGAGQILYPNTGISNYQQVQAPNINGYNYNSNTYTGNVGGQSGINDPNYYQGSTVNQTSPQITQGMAVGWHVDGNGRFYYQGNGVLLKSTWYLIDGQFYRFSNTGYLICNNWFQDENTKSWYFLSGDGHMVTGWEMINGTWYYFKPEAGMGYGTMYANTTLHIVDAKWGTGDYAFASNGAMVKNAWYAGHYYGNDGNRTN